MRKEDVAWVAGLFEGEGSAGAYGPHLTCALVFYLGDRDVLERVQATLGKGFLTERPRTGFMKKPAYALTIRPFEQVQAVAAMMWPWLGERRKAQIATMLTRHASMPRRARHRKCSIEGCDRPFLAKDLCSGHYQKVYRIKKAATA